MYLVLERRSKMGKMAMNCCNRTREKAFCNTRDVTSGSERSVTNSMLKRAEPLKLTVFQ